MKTSKQHPALSQTVIALAVFAAFSPAHSQDDIAQYITPESFVSAGVGAVSGDSKDRAIFGQYNGMRKSDFYGLVDFDYIKRDDATGTWTILQGLNLGLDTRELRFMRQKQGDWKYSAEYAELQRDYPRTINTGLLGVGTTTPTVVRLAAPLIGSDFDLKTKRKGAGLGYEKWISRSLQFEANFKNEDKTGARLWGRGYECLATVCAAAGAPAGAVGSALLLLPEPIDSVTRQIDARLNFHTEKLLASAGYYGSFYRNANGSISPTVPPILNGGLGIAAPLFAAAAGGTSLQNVLQLPVALPPDNQAHQLYLDGNYSFSPKTKANFKVSYSHATQDDSYAGMGLPGAPAGFGSLDARVDSTLAQLGVSTRPIDKLSVLGNVRYEHKNDKTPIAQYNIERTNRWNNSTTTSTRVDSKVEASYRLPADLRATVGVDHISQEREVPQTLSEENVAGLTALREKNRETGYRAELRRSMSETINGAVSYSRSKRTGSDWTSLSTLDPANPASLGANAAARAAGLALVNQFCGGVACYGQQLPATNIVGLSANAAFPSFMTDLERDKWKLSADWNPIERLSLQFVVEDGKDKNTAPFNPISGGKGWRDNGFTLYSVDAAFALSDNWKLTGYASHGDQTQHINHSSGYIADINDLSDAAGVGVIGKASGRLDVGANLSYLHDVNKYGLAATTTTTGTPPGALTVAPPAATNLAQAAIGLPDATFRQISLRFFGNYALDKKSGVRVDLIHQRVKFVEWQWASNGVPFVYADNTTVNMQQEQNVTFVGVSYIYKF